MRQTVGTRAAIGRRASGRGLAVARLLAATAVVAVSLVAAALLPAAADAAAGPDLSATAAILVAPSTGQTLYGLGADREVAIASTTKLMTALVTLEHTRLSQVFADPDYHPASSDSQLGLVPGERMTVHDLLLAMLLPSADDAAEDLAYNVGHGSVARFVAMMNRRARQLGLHHTHYSTPIGLDTPGNYSTASDLVKLAEYDLRTQPFFRRAVALPSAVLHSGDEVRVVANRNDLVGRVPWINGVKTGHTSDAGYVLVASARRDGMTLLSAVLGTSSEASRDENTLTLLDYGYSNFRRETPIRGGAVLARPTVKDRPGKRAVVIAARTFTRVLPRSTRVRVRVDVPRQLAGPLAKDAVVGTVVVTDGRRQIAREPLLLAQALPAVSAFTLAGHFMTRPSTVLLLLVLASVAIAVTVWRVSGRHRRARRTLEQQ